MTIAIPIEIEKPYRPEEPASAGSRPRLQDEEPEIAATLAQRIAAGDCVAEAQLFERYGPSLLGLLRRRGVARDLALDLRQEAFRIVLERLRRRGLAEPGRLAGFLRGTAHKLALAERRKSVRYPAAIDDTEAEMAEDPAPGPLQTALAKETREGVDRLLCALPTERDRQILRRFYLAEEDRERICSDLGLDRLHFNRVLFRARRRFKELAERPEAKPKLGVCYLPWRVRRVRRGRASAVRAI
jgi:RNA polymerase sigma-70 factor (ECF subfamily)